MDVIKPYEFIGLGAMDVTKPYELIWFFGAGYCSRGVVIRSELHGSTKSPSIPLECSMVCRGLHGMLVVIPPRILPGYLLDS